MSNVVKFTGITFLDMPPDTILEAAGVRLVPVNMTDEQMIAAERAVQASVNRGESAPIRFASLAVAAMLAASPYA